MIKNGHNLASLGAAKTFDALIESKIEHNKINAKLTANTDTAVESALDDEKAKNRKMLKEMELKHSEAMMTLLEATKGAVEQNVAAKVMEAGERAHPHPHPHPQPPLT